LYQCALSDGAVMARNHTLYRAPLQISRDPKFMRAVQSSPMQAFEGGSSASTVAVCNARSRTLGSTASTNSLLPRELRLKPQLRPSLARATISERDQPLHTQVPHVSRAFQFRIHQTASEPGGFTSRPPVSVHAYVQWCTPHPSMPPLAATVRMLGSV